MHNRRYFYPLLFGIVFALIGLAVQTSTVQAGPAAPIDIPLTQPDGTAFTARQWGDEWQHGYETVDGYTILQVEDGSWVYAAPGPDGLLAPVLQDGQPGLAGRDAAPSQALNARPAPPANGPARRFLDGGPRLGQNKGTQRLLMVMVNFADRTRSYTPAFFQDKAFGASNSIKDFYSDASFSQLNLQPAAETQGTANDGMIEVTLGMNHPSDTDQSRTIATAVYNAINPSINFANFDTDGDGYVTSTELHLVFIIAGYEESYGGCTYPCIWAHQWELASPMTLDGKYLGTSSADGDYGGYAMFGEIHYDHPAQIGIMAHELGHNLSWPDLYDTDNSSSGVGEWSIMGSGSWNGISQPGDSPALPDAWLKWYQGWITPTTAVNGQSYTLNRADSNAQALIMGTNSGGVDWEFTRYSGSGEFWLVENRQKNGYDADLPGCGLMVWHVDETRSYQNDANATDTHPLVYLEQADGLNGMLDSDNRGDAGDPYPGTSGNYYFNDTSSPNSRYYSGSSSNHALTVTTSGCATAMSVSYSGSGAQPVVYKTFLPFIKTPAPPPPPPPSPYTGKVTYKGAAKSGLTIKMYYTTNDWSSYSVYTTTKTDSKGNYKFSSYPAIGAGKEIQVAWENPDDDYAQPYLYAWYCSVVDDLAADKLTCSFDIQDVALSAPAHKGSVNLPYTFKWVKRTTSTDKYEVDWWDPDLGHYMWTDPLLGWVNSFTLYGIPSFFYTGFPYNWTVYPFGANGNGVPYWYRWVYFNDRSSPPLEGTGRTSDLFSADGRSGPPSLRFGPGIEQSQPRPAAPEQKPR